MNPSLIPQILKKGQIKSITLENGIGSTGEAHLAFLGKEKYLLRICPDEETANKYLGYYKKFKRYGFFPKLLETMGKYMLFEFVNGKRCREHETPETIRQVGRICAIINKAKVPKNYKRNGSFIQKLEEIKNKKVINCELAQKTLENYALLEAKIKLRLSMDAGDVTCDNFMVDKKGHVYFVDIEAIKPNIKGMGIAKAFSTWFKTPEMQKEFRRGYVSISPMSFYTEDYAKMVTLIFFIQRIRFKSNKGEIDLVKQTIKKLERILETK